MQANPGYGWNGDNLDLDAYLIRIGFDGERDPTLATLRRLVYLHTTGIPFENLDIILGRSLPLDIESLQDKMVRRRRGGACVEHAALFAAAAERLGFGVTGLTSRVVMGPLGGPPGSATHALLRVTTADDDRVWLCDVGYGSGPLEPIELASSDGEFTAGRWRYRLERGEDELGGDLWILHEFGTRGWIVRHTFTNRPQYWIDYAVAGHFGATSPHSPMVIRPWVHRFHPDAHHLLGGATWTIERPDGSSESRELERTDLPMILSEIFDVDLTEVDAARLVSEPWIIDKESSG